MSKFTNPTVLFDDITLVFGKRQRDTILGSMVTKNIYKNEFSGRKAMYRIVSKGNSFNVYFHGLTNTVNDQDYFAIHGKLIATCDTFTDSVFKAQCDIKYDLTRN